MRKFIDRDPVKRYAHLMLGHLMLGRTLERQGRHDEARPWPAASSGEFPDDA